MITKAINSNGQKAYQRTDTEDRSLPYRNWLRTVETNGFFIDIDFVKWKKINGVYTPVAITDITRCDSETAGDAYRDAIINRILVRDTQGALLQRLGELLSVPVYLILFQKEIKWFWVYSFAKSQWRQFTPEQWAKNLRML